MPTGRLGGAGKTTTLKSIMGIVGQRSGSVRYEGSELVGLTSDLSVAKTKFDNNGGEGHRRPAPM